MWKWLEAFQKNVDQKIFLSKGKVSKTEYTAYLFYGIFEKVFTKPKSVFMMELFCPKYSSVQLGETKLICWSTGRTDPAKSKKQYYKIIANWLLF